MVKRKAQKSKLVVAATSQHSSYATPLMVGLAVLVVLTIVGIIFFSGRSIISTPHHLAITTEEQFIAEMIPHHQEAIDSSQVILDITSNDKIKVIARNIIGTQLEEESLMEGWKELWYPDSTYVTRYHSMMPSLSGLSSNDADHAYIRGMIAHHEMAVDMAQDVLALNPRKEVATFAQTIIRVQTNEIAQLEALLPQN